MSCHLMLRLYMYIQQWWKVTKYIYSSTVLYTTLYFYSTTFQRQILSILLYDIYVTATVTYEIYDQLNKTYIHMMYYYELKALQVFSVMWLIRPAQVGVVQSYAGIYVRSPCTTKLIGCQTSRG